MNQEPKNNWAIGLCSEMSLYLYMVGDSKGAEPYFTYAEKACNRLIEQGDSSDYALGVIDCLAAILREYKVDLRKSCEYQKYTVDNSIDTNHRRNEYRACLAGVLGRLGEYSEALNHASKLLESIDRNWDTDMNPNLTHSSDLRAAYLQLFLILYWRGAYNEAFKIAERHHVALHPSGKIEPNYHSLCVASNFALAAIMVGEYDTAKNILNGCNEVQRKLYGEGAKNQDIAITHRLWGKLLRLQGRKGIDSGFNGARDNLLLALAIDEEIMGEDELDCAIELNELALLLDETSELSQSRGYAERALKIREKLLDTDHPLVAESLYALAAILYKQGELVEAFEKAKRALKICVKKDLVEEHYVVKELWKLLGKLCYELANKHI